MATPSPEPTFTARVLDRDGLVVVMLRGEADVTVAELSELEFLDSSGLRALIHAHSRISSQGRRFGVACPASGPVHAVLELTQLHRVMPVHPDRETAARALRG